MPRTEFVHRTFTLSDQAKPKAAGCLCGGNSCSEALPFVRFIEHMKATTVANERERATRGKSLRENPMLQSDKAKEALPSEPGLFLR